MLRVSVREAFVPGTVQTPAARRAFAPIIFATFLRRPGAVLAVFLAAHCFIWTLVPILVHDGMPMDVVEGYAIGREWVIGTYKHPAMPSWLLEVSRWLTGAVGWPAYVLSSSSVIATYAFGSLLGRDLTDGRRAAAGALLLSGVLYFSWVSPEFNHNVLQMPFWTGVIFALWRARRTGFTGWWALVGALAAGGIYAKLSTAVLLVVLMAYIGWDPKCRASLRVPGPWIGLGVFLVLAAPLANWLIDTNFQLLDYAEARAGSGRAGNVVLFLWKQIASSAGLLLLLALAAVRWHVPLIDTRNDDRQIPIAVSDDAARFIAAVYLGPIALMVFCAAITGAGLKGAWGTSMLSLTGLACIMAAGRYRIPLALHRIAAGAFVLLLAIPVAYAASVRLSDRFSKSPPRVAWPQQEIAARFQKIWWERTGQPLRIVAGDLWIGGMVATLAQDRPALLIEGDLGRSPWLDRAKLEKHGALIVTWRRLPMLLQHDFPHVRALGVESSEVFHVDFGRQGRDLTVYYIIVPPGTKLKTGELKLGAMKNGALQKRRR